VKHARAAVDGLPLELVEGDVRDAAAVARLVDGAAIRVDERAHGRTGFEQRAHDGTTEVSRGSGDRDPQMKPLIRRNSGNTTNA